MPPPGRPKPIGLAIPAYAHPVEAPDAWARLSTLDLGAGFVVLNVADGPGEAADAGYLPSIEPLRARGALCGYVDSDYGRRAGRLILRDVARYRDWYGVTSVFIDQVASSGAALPYYQDVVSGLRLGGTDRVVLNPGVVPDPGIAALGDVTVIFEGTWEQHRRLITPGWTRRALPPRALCHLVYAIPSRASLDRVVTRATATGAGILGVSSQGLPNPWSMTGMWATAVRRAEHECRRG